MSKPELTAEDRAEFWRRKHDLLITSFAADKARFEFEALMKRLNAKAEEDGCQLAAGPDGEPRFAPKPIEIKKETAS